MTGQEIAIAARERTEGCEHSYTPIEGQMAKYFCSRCGGQFVKHIVDGSMQLARIIDRVQGGEQTVRMMKKQARRAFGYYNDDWRPGVHKLGHESSLYVGWQPLVNYVRP